MNRFGVLALGMLTGAGLGLAAGGSLMRRTEPPTPANLEERAEEILVALEARDWSRFARLSEPRLELVQYMRLYPQDWSAEQRQTVLPDVLFSREEIDGVVLQHSILIHGIDTTQPLDETSRAAFLRFCKLVRTTRSDRSFHISVEQESGPSEIPLRAGSSISAPVVSNVDWRVELQPRDGTWYVSRLAVGAH